MWAGQRNLRIGDRIVGIGWDDEAAANALRTVCDEWPSAAHDAQAPVAFGVRSVAVGLRRRRIWLVHHGTPVRHRADDLSAAIRFVGRLLRGLDARLADDEVGLPCRAFSRGGRAVIVHVLDDVDVDERPLRKRGIEQLPSLATVVRPATSAVVHPDGDFEVVGAVVDGRLLAADAALDDRRRHLQAMAWGERRGWSWVVDGLGERIVVANDLTAGIQRLLG